MDWTKWGESNVNLAVICKVIKAYAMQDMWFNAHYGQGVDGMHIAKMPELWVELIRAWLHGLLEWLVGLAGGGYMFIWHNHSAAQWCCWVGKPELGLLAWRIHCPSYIGHCPSPNSIGIACFASVDPANSCIKPGLNGLSGLTHIYNITKPPTLQMSITSRRQIDFASIPSADNVLSINTLRYASTKNRTDLPGLDQGWGGWLLWYAMRNVITE